jgi:pyruvate/2-oxoglutarate dehydrogenase complex dihydrolipoamide dehydrogenase (E3) component
MVVIGAGSAGLVTSYVAAAAKAKVALVERHKMGGDCLNTGCVPSKALIRSASFLRDAKRAQKLGIKKVEVEFDFAEIMERVQRVIGAIEPHDSVERYTNLGVDCVVGNASIKSPHEVEVEGRVLTTRTIVVAAGARPFVPPIKGIELSDYRTSDTIWEIREQPRRLMVVGGGPIGSELAQAFAYLGTEVTQIEDGERIMAREDADASAIVMEHFREAGVNIMTKTRAREVVVEDGQKIMLVECDGKEEKVPFDLLLLATGRQPNGDKVPGLAEVGVKISKRGVVEVNEKLQTSVPNIYACGDIIGSYQFTHTAAHAAVYAATNALLPIKRKVDWSVVPWCTFTHPEVARVGLNEQEAKDQNIPHEVAKYGIDDLDRAIADEEAEGFVKLLTEPGSKKLLGVTIVGDHAGDLIHEYILAMKKGLKVTDILGMIHIYPTLAESNRFAASEWYKAHPSSLMLSISEWLNRRNRG